LPINQSNMATRISSCVFFLSSILCFSIDSHANADVYNQYNNGYQYYRILNSRSVVLDAPMIKDKATRELYLKHLEDGSRFSYGAAKKMLNKLEKENLPAWLQDGISEEEEKVIQSLNGFNVKELMNTHKVLTFEPEHNTHLTDVYRFKKPFSLTVSHYGVGFNTSFEKIQSSADTSQQTKKINTYTQYPVQLNQLVPFYTQTFQIYYPEWQLKEARMKKLFQADSLTFLRIENANLWPTGITAMPKQDLNKLKAYYLFSIWQNKKEYLYIRIPGKENAALFPEIGFIPHHDLYYTIENNNSYITWTGSKPVKDFRIDNIKEVMRKSMLAYANHHDYRDLYKPGAVWDVNKNGSMIPTELYVLHPKSAGQVIHRKDKLGTYQLMVPLEKSYNEHDAKQTAYQLAVQVAEEANIVLKPGGEPIQFYLGEPRSTGVGMLYTLQYKNDALLGDNQYQVFAIMSNNDVVWLNYIFRNEIYGYLF